MKNQSDFSTLWFGQMKVLDMLNQERAIAERKNMIHRIKQEVARGREDTMLTQVSQLQPTGFLSIQGTHGKLIL